MRSYKIEYIMYQADKVKSLCVDAENKEQAYDEAVYEIIPNGEDGFPYAAWVESVRFNNGKLRRFNTFAGKPY